MPQITSHSLQLITCIFIGSDDRSFENLHRIFTPEGWNLIAADSWEHAVRLLPAIKATHVLYEHVPNDDTWIEALSTISLLPSAPAFILTSRLADERLWAEVLNRGGYDLLLEPFDSVEVTRVIAAACQRFSRSLATSASRPK